MTDAEPPDSPVLALVRDLLFGSKISGTARGIGLPIQMIRDPAKLSGASGRLLLVDLALDGAIAAAGEWRKASAKPVIGFVSHVDTATAAAAHQAGIRVMTRGSFTAALPELLSGRGL